MLKTIKLVTEEKARYTKQNAAGSQTGQRVAIFHWTIFVCLHC